MQSQFNLLRKDMKIKHWLSNFLIISIMLGIAHADKGEIIGRITLILGNVLIQSDGDTNWVVAKLNNPVYNNDFIKTEVKSRAEISIHSSQIIRIGENSITQITEKFNHVQVKSSRGKTWLNVVLFGNQDFVIKTPTAVAAIRGTIYRVNCDSISSMFRVYEGTVAIQPNDPSADSVFLVTKGKELVLTKDIDEYLLLEKKEIENYIKDQKDIFNEFQKNQENQFSKFKSRDQEAFQNFHDLNIRLKNFDTTKDSLFEWVQWNNSLDSNITR